MPDIYISTINSLIAPLARWLTLMPEMAPAGCTIWILVNIAKAVT